jgi:hypothetical protein
VRWRASHDRQTLSYGGVEYRLALPLILENAQKSPASPDACAVQRAMRAFAAGTSAADGSTSPCWCTAPAWARWPSRDRLKVIIGTQRSELRSERADRQRRGKELNFSYTRSGAASWLPKNTPENVVQQLLEPSTRSAGPCRALAAGGASQLAHRHDVAGRVGAFFETSSLPRPSPNRSACNRSGI